MSSLHYLKYGGKEAGGGAAIRTSVKIGSFAALALVIYFTLRTDTAALLLAGDTEALRQQTHGSFFLLLIITLLLMVVQNLFTIIPLLLMITVNVSVFGFWQGYLWSWVTSLVGATVCFFVTRYWFQDLFNRIINEKLRGKIENSGAWFVFVGRVLPFMPTSVVNIASGMSSLQYKGFFYATLWGNMIYFLALSALSQGFVSASTEVQVLVAAAAVVLFFGIKRWRGKRAVPAEADKRL